MSVHGFCYSLLKDLHKAGLLEDIIVDIVSICNHELAPVPSNKCLLLGFQLKSKLSVNFLISRMMGILIFNVFFGKLLESLSMMNTLSISIHTGFLSDKQYGVLFSRRTTGMLTNEQNLSKVI